MDAASCFILGTALVSADTSEPNELEARRLFKDAWAHKRGYPKTLILPTDRYGTALTAEAKRQRVSVVAVNENQLLVFTGEARQGFRQYLRRET